jgi:hypothetical protein
VGGQRSFKNYRSKRRDQEERQKVFPNLTLEKIPIGYINKKKLVAEGEKGERIPPRELKRRRGKGEERSNRVFFDVLDPTPIGIRQEGL